MIPARSERPIHEPRWLSKEEYATFKPQFIEANRHQFDDTLKNPLFGNLTPQQRELGGRIMAHFQFGMSMAYNRFGNKYNNFSFNYLSMPGVRAFSYHPETDQFFINSRWLSHVLVNPERYLQELKHFGGISSDKFTLENIAEIAGVEEAAHLIYFHEKKAKPSPEAARGHSLSTFTKEEEKRALLWKSSYVGRYMPEYADSLSETISLSRELRLKAAQGEDISTIPQLDRGEETRTLERAGWLSQQEYHTFRELFMKNNFQPSRKTFDTVEAFQELTDDEKNLGTQLVERFLCGMEITSRRFGNMYRTYNLTWNISEGSDFLGLDRSGDKIFIHANTLKMIIQAIGAGKHKISGMDVSELIPIPDFMELAGVELAAHSEVLRRQKDGDSETTLHQAMHRLAVRTKRSYTSRYMPEYYPLLEEAVRRLNQ